MSNSISKVVFPDGTELFGVGDCSVFAMDELFVTCEEAWSAYVALKEDRGGDIYDSRINSAQETAEPVECWTTYGSGDWVEMFHQNATASKLARLIVRHPRHHEERW
jgi:hypothetical protein